MLLWHSIIARNVEDISLWMSGESGKKKGGEDGDEAPPIFMCTIMANPLTFLAIVHGHI